MRVLVTGSSGRIGSAVVQALLGRGHVVRGFDLRPTGRQDAGYDEVTGKLEDANAVALAVVEVEAVLHLGAFMSWVATDRAAMFRTNVEGTHVLADAASAAGVGRFVFASSGEVYPENSPQFQPITEDHPLTPTSAYGLTKLLGEQIIQFHQRSGTMQTVILRFSHTQDATELLDEDSLFSGPRFFLRPRIRQQEAFGNHAVVDILRHADPGHPAHVLACNQHGRPFRMHITETRDMVQGILLSMTHTAAAGQAFNLGATNPVDFADLLPQVAQYTGLPIVTVDLPGQGVFYHTANDKIRATLGYNPEWPMDRILKEAAKARTERLRA
jgi:UDP-glucose 4-epimerase